MGKIIILLFLVLSLHQTVYAQFSIGPKISLGFSTFRYSKVSYEYDTDGTNAHAVVYQYLFTPQLGLVTNTELSSAFALRVELLYMQRGYSSSSTLYSDRINQFVRLSYLELPISLIAHAPVGSGRIEVAAGPSLGYGLGGKYVSEQYGVTTVKAVKFGKVLENSDGSIVYYNPLHVSINVGIGYRVRRSIVQFTYNMGLSSLNPHYKNEQEEGKRNLILDRKSSSFNLSFICLFGLKKN